MFNHTLNLASKYKHFNSIYHYNLNPKTTNNLYLHLHKEYLHSFHSYQADYLRCPIHFGHIFQEAAFAFRKGRLAFVVVFVVAGAGDDAAAFSNAFSVGWLFGDGFEVDTSRISGLTQGIFVGSVADNFEERIDQKIFHSEIVVDNAKVTEETKSYQKIPEFTNFINEKGENVMQQEIERNYYRIKEEAQQIVDMELAKLKDDPRFKDLVK